MQVQIVNTSASTSTDSQCSSISTVFVLQIVNTSASTSTDSQCFSTSTESVLQVIDSELFFPKTKIFILISSAAYSASLLHPSEMFFLKLDVTLQFGAE